MYLEFGIWTSIRNDVDDYFDGYSDELATFDVPSDDPTLGSEKASSRIGTLWRRTGTGAAFARWDSTPDRERTLDAARTVPAALKDGFFTSRLGSTRIDRHQGRI